MELKKRCQTELNNAGFRAKFLISIAFLLFLVSCNFTPKTDYEENKEQRLRVKPVMLVEKESISKMDIMDMINNSSIRKGGYVAIMPTSFTRDNKANKLRNLFYNQKIEAVHILNINLHLPIKNTDLLAIENATILCLLDGDIEKIGRLVENEVLKSAIVKAYERGTLLVFNGNTCSLADDPIFTIDEDPVLNKID